MGCKESKHIAPDNTIISPTSSTKSTNRGQDDNDKNNVQTLQKSRSGKSMVQKQESPKENNVDNSKANNVLNENKKSGDKESIKENAKVGEEAIVKKKKDQNGNAGDSGGKESILIPKEDIPSTSTKDGESNEAIDSNSVSGPSVYCTPTEVADAFDNAKTDNSDEERKEPVEETKDTKTEETTAEENFTRIVDATIDNYVREAEVDRKIKEAEAAVATPGNHLPEAEVEGKIKDAEAAVEYLEKLVTKNNPVKETEEISSVQNPEKEADKSGEILDTQVAATDATPQNPVDQTDKSKENPETETKDTDATLQDAVTESDKTKENLIKEAGEAVENGVKEIHEVTGKAEDIRVKEVNQASVADEAEEVLDKKSEADKVEETLVTAAEAANTAVNKLESVAKAQSQDAASTEEDAESSGTANERQISKEDTDVQKNTDEVMKQ